MSVRVILNHPDFLLAKSRDPFSLFQSSDFCGPSSLPYIVITMYIIALSFFLLTSSVGLDQQKVFFCAANFRKISHFGHVAGAWCGEDLRRGEARLRANRAQLNKIPLVFWRWSRLLNRALSNQKVLFALVFWRALGILKMDSEDDLVFWGAPVFWRARRKFSH